MTSDEPWSICSQLCMWTTKSAHVQRACFGYHLLRVSYNFSGSWFSGADAFNGRGCRRILFNENEFVILPTETSIAWISCHTFCSLKEILNNWTRKSIWAWIEHKIKQKSRICTLNSLDTNKYWLYILFLAWRICIIKQQRRRHGNEMELRLHLLNITCFSIPSLSFLLSYSNSATLLKALIVNFSSFFFFNKKYFHYVVFVFLIFNVFCCECIRAYSGIIQRVKTRYSPTIRQMAT